MNRMIFYLSKALALLSLFQSTSSGEGLTKMHQLRNFLALQNNKTFSLHWEGDPLQAVVLASRNCLANDSKGIEINAVHRKIIEHATRQNLRVIMLTADHDKSRTSCEIAYNGSVVEFLAYPEQHIQTIWIRDYGGIVGSNSDGTLRIYDPKYLKDRQRDDDTPRVLARYLRMRRSNLEYAFEGGHVLTNGYTCIVSSVVLDRNPGKTVNDVEEYFKTRLGCGAALIVTSLKDNSNGRLDTWMTFADNRTLLIGEYELGVDPDNRRIQASNIEMLATYIDLFTINTLKMPTNCPSTPGGMAPKICIGVPHRDRVFRSYMNFFYLGDTIIMPKYMDLNETSDPYPSYENLLNRKNQKNIVRVGVTDLIKEGGIHVMTSSIPG